MAKRSAPRSAVASGSDAAAPVATAPDTLPDPINAAPGDPDFMTSLARGLTVIGAFTRQKRQLTIAQIEEHRPGAHRSDEQSQDGKEARVGW